MSLRARRASREYPGSIYSSLVDVERGYVFALLVTIPVTIVSVTTFAVLITSGGWAVLAGLCVGLFAAFGLVSAWFLTRLRENRGLVLEAADAVALEIRAGGYRG